MLVLVISQSFCKVIVLLFKKILGFAFSIGFYRSRCRQKRLAPKH